MSIALKNSRKGLRSTRDSGTRDWGDDRGIETNMPSWERLARVIIGLNADRLCCCDCVDSGHEVGSVRVRGGPLIRGWWCQSLAENYLSGFYSMTWKGSPKSRQKRILMD